MAYNEALANRVRAVLAHQKGISERSMFGGITFLVDDKMCCGVQKDDLILRLSAEGYQQALANPHARPMDFTGRPMSGFLYVGPGGYETDEDLQGWVRKAVVYVASLPPKSSSRGLRKRSH